MRRAQSLENTLSDLNALKSTLGITRVADITGLDCLQIPIVSAIRPASRHISVAMGKGASLEQAQVSALMEALEGYAIEKPLPVSFTGSFLALQPTEAVINPEMFNTGQFSKPQLQQFSLDWVKAKEWFTGEVCHIPHCLTCIDSTRNDEAYAYFQVSSNGLAAGNTPCEAICHCLLEVIERHAFANWRQKADTDTEHLLNLANIQDANQNLIQKILKADLNLKIWDIQLEDQLPIPAFHVAMEDKNVIRSLGIATGTAAHIDKAQALTGAICEAVQSRLALISGMRDDIFPEFYAQIQKDDLTTIKARKKNGMLDYANIQEKQGITTYDEALVFLKQSLKALGIEQIFIIDHSDKALKFPVIQMIIPGFDFASGRIL